MHDLKSQILSMRSLSAGRTVMNRADALLIQSPRGCTADERQINAGTTIA
ncbi:hypothetical protein [Afipia clevelandensis]|nr:hypothetical protein [Afipia clevelandensis]EGP09148.1 hypothetical protein CSIRO_1311 [Bradyrhizobiaceae bacterium SG-6C]